MLKRISGFITVASDRIRVFFVVSVSSSVGEADQEDLISEPIGTTAVESSAPEEEPTVKVFGVYLPRTRVSIGVLYERNKTRTRRVAQIL